MTDLVAVPPLAEVVAVNALVVRAFTSAAPIEQQGRGRRRPSVRIVPATAVARARV